MFRFVLLLISCSVFKSVACASEFPSDIKQCTHADGACLADTITQILRTHKVKGHRGLNLIPFDPLHIKSLTLPKIPDSPVSVEFKFKDIQLTGISQATVTKVAGFTKEPSDLVLEIAANLPKVVISGPYSINGNVLVLPIVGQGNSEIIFDNTNAIAKVKCTTVEKDGKIFLSIVKIHLDLKPKRMIFALENLSNGDKALGENMNQFLNENWDSIYSELKLPIEEAMSKILLHIANGVFSKFPYNDLFLSS